MICLDHVGQAPSYTILDTLSTPDFIAVWYEKNGEVEVTATHAPIDVQANYKSRHQKKAYTKLQKKVIKVYPYAKAAGDVMTQFEAKCALVSSPEEKKMLLKKAETEMKIQFEKDLRELTVSEGVILIKLIDRQTGESSYELVSELKGKMSAFMWQGVARVFGHNLKDQYEAEGEDVWIENTIELIENGTIPVTIKAIRPFGS
jgi:Domain of unknown function (DUF4294)